MKHSLAIADDVNVFRIPNKRERTPLVLWTLILFMFVSVGRIQELIPGLEKLYLGKVFGVLMLVAYFTYSGPKNRVSLKGSPELVCILGIVIFSLWSVPFSVWPGGSVDFLSNFLIKNLAFCYIIARVLTNLNQLRKVIFALLSVTVLLSIVALAGHGDVSRITASMTYDPNDLAFVLLCVLPFAAFGFFEEKGIKKILLFLVVGLMIVTIIFTISRSGFVGLIVVSGMILLKTFKKRILMTILFLSLSVVVLVYVAPPDFWERMSTMTNPEEDYNVTSYAGRIEVWKRGVKLIMEHPVTGVGIGQFGVAEGESHKDIGGKWSAAHNSFIQIGAELGLGGLILFVLLFYYILKRIRSVPKNNRKILIFINSFVTSFLVYVVVGFFLSQAYNTILYLFIGMTIALSNIAKEFELRRP
jgi:O-antigen ligase